MADSPNDDKNDRAGRLYDQIMGGGGNKKGRDLVGDALAGKEKDGDGGKSGGLGSLAATGLLGREKSGGGGENPLNYTGGGAKWGKARNFLQKHQKKVIAGALGSIGILPLLALLIFMLGVLKIPHFVENMATWRFAKLTNQYRKSMTNVVNEKNVIDSLDDADKERARAKYGKYPIFDKVNRLRPNKVLQGLQSHDRVQYNYRTTLTGKQKLVSITIAEGQDVSKKTTIKVPTGRFDRLLHPLRTMDQYKQISTALSSAMKAHDPKIPTVVRAAATKAVIKKAGGSLRGLVASRYLGKTDRDAKITIQQDTYKATKDSGGIAALTADESKKLAQDVDKVTDEVVDDKEKIGASVDKGGGIPDQVLDAVEKGTDPSRMRAVVDKIIGFANPVYDIAVPVCMMYDGSKITSESLDAQQNATMRESLLMMAVADQQKNGNEYSKHVGGAINWKAGDIQDSNTMRRVSGKPVDTTQGLGGQRTTLGTYGQYTIFDALTDGNGGAFNAIADDLCPVATNIWVGIGLGVVNIAVIAVTSILSGGAAGGAEVAATQAAKTAVTKGIIKVVTKQITSFTLKKGIRAFAKSGRFAKRYATDVVKYGAATAGATFVARMIVMSKAGTMTSGLETGGAFLDNVDDGTNHVANEAGRANYRGRPQTNVEMVQNHKVDQAEMALYNTEKTTFERYLAIENPNSLLSRVGITTASLLNKGFFASILNSIATLFNPTSLSSRLFASANAQAAYAAGPMNTQDYGNVQWEYSLEEQRLMEQDSYASPSENAFILGESGKEQEINDTYDKCYTKSVGQLLADGDITRNEEGDVLPEGDCSPLQLGPHNPEYGDLVFRWRLKFNYDNTAGLLLGIQDPQKGSANVGSNSTTIPTGTAQQLATQILNSDNIDFQVEPEQRRYMEIIAQTGKARECGGPAVDPKMLGVILALSQKYKIVIGVVVDGHDCNGGFHPKGQAFDMNGINPLSGGGGTGNYIRWTTAEQPILKRFYADAGNILAQAGGGGLGQIQCFTGSAPALNPAVTYFNDTCHHLHVDIGKR